MRTLYFCLFLLALLLPASAVAQTAAATHPSDSAASLIGNFTTTIIFPASSAPRDREVGGHTNVCVFRMSTGQIEYLINTDSIRLTGTWSAGDTVATADLIDNLSRATVAQGISRGFTSCVATGATGARVLNSSYVQRTGSGTATRFTHCSAAGYSARLYDISCQNGASTPSITLLPPTYPLPSGAGMECEPTRR
jgi:hypothetical protein